MAQPVPQTSATSTLTPPPPTTHSPLATLGDQHDLLHEPGLAPGLHCTALPITPQPPPTSITYIKSKHKKHSITVSRRLRKQPLRDGKTPWSSIGNNSRSHREARVAGSSAGEEGGCEQEDEGELPRGRCKQEEEGELPREQLEGPVDLGYDPGPREAAIQNRKLRTLWLPKNHKVKQRDRAGMARYKQCRVAVSPAA